MENLIKKTGFPILKIKLDRNTTTTTIRQSFEFSQPFVIRQRFIFSVIVLLFVDAAAAVVVAIPCLLFIGTEPEEKTNRMNAHFRYDHTYTHKQKHQAQCFVLPDGR